MILITFIASQSCRHCFVQSSKLLFYKVFIISLVLLCSGCGAKHIDQTNVDSIMRDFAAGTIKLGSGTYGYGGYRRKMRTYYKISDWESLAKAVIEGDFESDTDWYYLGRSAEGLKLYRAAKIYYTKVLSTIYKCYKYSNDNGGCEEDFVFPRDITVRLNALPGNNSQPKNEDKT